MENLIKIVKLAIKTKIQNIFSSGLDFLSPRKWTPCSDVFVENSWKTFIMIC